MTVTPGPQLSRRAAHKLQSLMLESAGGEEEDETERMTLYRKAAFEEMSAWAWSQADEDLARVHALLEKAGGVDPEDVMKEFL